MALGRTALIPSKIALRVLRDLALGSSVVIGAVFTEDRRRCLHTLSKVADNARTLKASSRYHEEMQKSFLDRVSSAQFDAADELLQEYETGPEADEATINDWRVQLLRGAWKNTRDMQQTSSMFNRLAARFDRVPPNTRFFNRMIFACIRAGDENMARTYLRQMKDEYGIPPDARTHGFFILGSARRGDWDAVEHGLKELGTFRNERGFRFAYRESFNPVLAEYIKAFGVQQALDRVFQAMQEHQFVPNQHTSDLLVTAMIVEGKLDDLERWLPMMIREGLRFTSETFDGLLQRYWKGKGHRWRLGFQRIEEMINRVHAVDSELVDERLTAWANHTARAMIPASSHVKQRPRRFAQIGTPGLPDNSDSVPADERDVISVRLLRRMRHLIGTERNAKAALQLFKNAEAQGIKTSAKVFSEGVVAALIAKRGDTTEARNLIKSAGPGRNAARAVQPLLVAEMNRKSLPLESVPRIAVHFYRLLEEEHEEIIHHVTAHAVHTLLRGKKSRQAIHLLLSIRASWWGKKCPLDIVCMKLLLIAYFNLTCIPGVQWVVSEVLQLDMPVNEAFLLELQKRTSFYNKYNPGKNESALAALAEDVRERWFAQKRRVAEKHESMMRATEHAMERMASTRRTPKKNREYVLQEQAGGDKKSVHETASGKVDSSAVKVEGEEKSTVISPTPPVPWEEIDPWSSSMLWTPQEQDEEDEGTFFRPILLERNRSKFVRASSPSFNGGRKTFEEGERFKPVTVVQSPWQQQHQLMEANG
ncbi:MAG: ferrochelatase hem15 [Watsoniomyces obsoletus]|nr:MAG: ferrochelatase hem15 [Watsoniomyces obsoletus]